MPKVVNSMIDPKPEFSVGSQVILEAFSAPNSQIRSVSLSLQGR
uniref:Uncharacterized protein n=1 Tax=Arundo donax TaxID=35708 RepID=A0A0A9BZA5_ARUDO